MGSVGIGMFGFRAFRSRLEIKRIASWACLAGATKLGVPKVGLEGLETPSPNFSGTGPANALLNTRHGLFFHRCPPTCGTHYLRLKEGGNTRKTLEIACEQAGYGLLLCTATIRQHCLPYRQFPKHRLVGRYGTSGTECGLCTRVRGRACGAIQVGVPPLGSDMLANHASVGGAWVICSASFSCF
jgi:hypothetical protein